MSDEERARVELVEVCQRLYSKGWVANHDGNVSIRVGDDRIVATPTAVSKGDVRLEQLIVVNLRGEKLEGTRRPFSELALHLKAYRERPDVRAVVHAHPVNACAFAVSGTTLLTTFMPEAVVSLGDTIPTAPLALPYGDEGAAALNGLLDDYDALLLSNHGVLTLGPDVWTAFYRLELLEHLAKIQLASIPLGGPRLLDRVQIESLLERRTKAGLGPEARGKTRSTSPWGNWTQAAPTLPTGPAPSAWHGVDLKSPCSGEKVSVADEAQLQATLARIPGNEELKRLLEQEVRKALGSS